MWGILMINFHFFSIEEFSNSDGTGSLTLPSLKSVANEKEFLDVIYWRAAWHTERTSPALHPFWPPKTFSVHRYPPNSIRITLLLSWLPLFSIISVDGSSHGIWRRLQAANKLSVRPLVVMGWFEKIEQVSASATRRCEVQRQVRRVLCKKSSVLFETVFWLNFPQRKRGAEISFSCRNFHWWPHWVGGELPLTKQVHPHFTLKTSDKSFEITNSQGQTETLVINLGLVVGGNPIPASYLALWQS